MLSIKIYKEGKAEKRGTEKGEREKGKERGREEGREVWMEGGRERFVREKIICSLVNAS